MKVNLSIDSKYKELSVEVKSPEMNQEVQLIMNKLNKQEVSSIQTVIGYKDEAIVILKVEDIVSFSTWGNHVMADTLSDSFRVKEKLYTLEAQFESYDFIRISKSALVNINHIKQINIHFSGSLIMSLNNDKDEVISRRYVSKVKQAIGIGGRK